MTRRQRSGIVWVLCGFIVFGLGWSALQRLTDPAPTFVRAAVLNPLLPYVFYALFALGCAALLLFLGAGAPLLAAAVRNAWRGRQFVVLFWFGSALACLAAFIAATLILAAWHPGDHIVAFLLGYLALSALLLVLGTVSVSLVVLRSALPSHLTRFVRWPRRALVAMMTAALVLAAVLILLVAGGSPHLFITQDVNGRLFAGGLALMVVGIGIALVGSSRSQSGLDSPSEKRIMP